ncbi:MAG TPA: hypothetical protein PLO37_15555 [Candidatus Hydrogenedentes bacterium]|nr:hypothetical protein [Candidatus Hydrogenedentota bacterium]
MKTSGFSLIRRIAFTVVLTMAALAFPAPPASAQETPPAALPSESDAPGLNSSSETTSSTSSGEETAALPAIPLADATPQAIVPAAAEAAVAEPADQQVEKQSEDEKIKVILSLNYIIASLTKIISYNDKVILDQEYDAIINNRNQRNIPDARIISLLTKLMKQITSNQIADTEKGFIEDQYRKNINAALKDAIVQGVKSVSFTANPYTTLASGVMNAGSVYFNYTQRIEAYKDEKKTKEWEIDKGLMVELNDIRSGLLKASWELLNVYKIPDSWRLSEKQLDEYTNILKDTDASEEGLSRRWRRLERLEESFLMFPPYWYYRGETAQHLNQREEALRCYEHYDNAYKEGIFRKDPFAASVAMNRVMLIDDPLTPDTVPVLTRNIETIVKNSESRDWSLFLFAALQYARIGKQEEAAKLILMNIDNGYEQTLDNPAVIQVLGKGLLVDAQPEICDQVLNSIVAADSLKNYDILFLYGELLNKDIVRRIADEINSVMVLPAPYSYGSWNLYKKFWNDGLDLILPTRWFPDNVDVSLSVGISAEAEGETISVTRSKYELTGTSKDDKCVVLHFPDILPMKELMEEDKQAEVRVTLAREVLSLDRTTKPKYTFESVFKSQVVTAKEEKKRWEKCKDLVLNVSRPLVKWVMDEKDEAKVLSFRKVEVTLNGEKFSCGPDGIIIP